MKIYPILGVYNAQYNKTNFNASVPQKEIKKIGADYIERSEKVTDKFGMYDLARRYFHGEIMPLLERAKFDRKQGAYHQFRQEVVNSMFSRIELDFNPELIIFKKNAAGYTLDKEKKNFRSLVGSVNSIADRWKKFEDKK